jgi:GDP-D-mannose dehydratase
MWLYPFMLKCNSCCFSIKKDDFCIATGKNIVRDFVDAAVRELGIGITWKGQGMEESITTDECPIPAHRPLNSMFNCHKTTEGLGVSQPDRYTGLNRVPKSWKVQ